MYLSLNSGMKKMPKLSDAFIEPYIKSQGDFDLAAFYIEHHRHMTNEEIAKKSGISKVNVSRLRLKILKGTWIVKELVVEDGGKVRPRCTAIS